MPKMCKTKWFENQGRSKLASGGWGSDPDPRYVTPSLITVALLVNPS